MRRDFFGAARRHDLEPRAAARLDRSASSTTSSTSATATASTALLRERQAGRWSCTAPPSRPTTSPPQRPFDDFDVNAVGTLNLLEAARRHAPESPFVFMSTNKVYGDAPNELAARRARRRAGTTPTPRYHDGHRRDDADRPDACTALRRVQGRRRRAGAGVRPLLRHARPSASAAAASPARTTPAPSCTGSSLPRARDPRGAHATGSSATRASRCATTSTRTTSAPRSWRSPSDPRRPRSTTSAAAARTAVSLLEAIDRLEELIGRKLDTRVRRRAAARRPHLLHQRPLAPAEPTIPSGRSRSRWTRC